MTFPVCAMIVNVFIASSAGQTADLGWQNIQFLDSCPVPSAPPVVCQDTGWIRRGSADRAINYYICVDGNKKIVYRGTGAEMVET